MDTKPPDKNKPAARPDEVEEVAHLDDAVIGRAFRGSFIALILIVVLGAGAWWVLRKKPDAKPTQVTKLSAPVSPNRAVQEIPTARFTEVTAASGIQFVHYSGA